MKKHKSESIMTERYFKKLHVETNLVELDEDLSVYPHCRLPNHYFDLLLNKSVFVQDGQGQLNSQESATR